GAAALLAEARPDLDASGLRGALVTSARRGSAGEEPGLVSPAAASAVELVAEPSALALPALVGKKRGASGSVTLRNVSRRVLGVPLPPGAGRGRARGRAHPD